MKTIFRYPLYLMYLLLFAGLYPLSAQWNNDPLQNLAVADTSGEQVLPKIQPTSDGGCYISWFDSRSGNYDVYLQRLNARGEIQWAPKGLLVSNHPQQSWLVDYDLAVDPDDNALLVFADIRNGGSSDLDVFAYKIAPDGSFLWGPDGIGLSDVSSSDFEAAPKVAATGGDWWRSPGRNWAPVTSPRCNCSPPTDRSCGENSGSPFRAAVTRALARRTWCRPAATV